MWHVDSDQAAASVEALCSTSSPLDEALATIAPCVASPGPSNPHHRRTAHTLLSWFRWSGHAPIGFGRFQFPQAASIVTLSS